MDIFYINKEFRFGPNKEIFHDNNREEFQKSAEKIFDEIDNVLVGMFKYKNIQIYNFARGTVIEDTREILLKIYSLYNINKGSSEGIILFTDDNSIYELCGLLNWKVEKIDNKQKNIKKSYKYLKFIKKILKSHCRYSRFKRKNRNGKANMLVIMNVSGNNKIRFNGKNIYYDSFYGKVYEDLKSNYNILELKYDRIERISENKDFDKYISLDYLSLRKKIYRIFYKLKSKDIENNICDLNKYKFNYLGIDITNVLKKFIFTNLEDKYYSYIYEIINAEKLIKSKCISKVITIDEADRFRCFIYAANMNNIESYAIQHGLINKVSYSYMIPDKDKKLVPKKTFLWGEEFKEQLINYTNIYNNENIFVVGQPRTDILYDLLQENIRVKNPKLRVLYATQPILDLTEQATEIICSAFANLDNYEIMIKLHPSDKNNELYNNLIVKYNLTNVKIVKEMDIYECLIWCDVVISVHSTVILEGAILNKPSICILLSDYYDLGDFVKDGISIGVESDNELINVINNGVENIKVPNNHIKRYFYNVDGLVHNRIVEEIINDI